MTNAEARFNKSHIRKVYAYLAVTCHLHFLAEWPGFFTCYCGNTGGGTDTEIRVSTESRPWRRKFSRRSSRDSNPRPFNHESGALTTELSPPPRDHIQDAMLYIVRWKKTGVGNGGGNEWRRQTESRFPVTADACKGLVSTTPGTNRRTFW